MDVYKLILEQGTLGALKYANKIEDINPNLASEIDSAVIRLCKIARVGDNSTRTAQRAQAIPYPSGAGSGFSVPSYQQQQNSAPAYRTRDTGNVTEQGYYRPTNETTNKIDSAAHNPWWPIDMYIDYAPDAYKLRKGPAGIQAIPQVYNQKLKVFEKLIKNGHWDEAIEILNKSQKEFVTLGKSPVLIRQKFLDTAKTALGKPQELQKFINQAAASLKSDLASGSKLLKKIPLVNKIPQLTGTNWTHPAVESFDGFTPAQKNQFRGKTVEEVLEFLQNTAGQKTRAKLFQKHISPGGLGFEASEKFLQTAPTKNAGIVKKILFELAEKFPKLAEVLGKFAKFLGPIAVLFETVGVIQDFQTYGLDAKTGCNILSALAGFASLVGLPYAAPIWLIISVGCMFVQHGPKKAQDGGPKENPAEISDEKVNALVGKIKMSDLSPGDQATAREIYNEFKAHPDQLNEKFNQATQKGMFDKPSSVLAGLETQMQGGSFFE